MASLVRADRIAVAKL